MNTFKDASVLIESEKGAPPMTVGPVALANLSISSSKLTEAGWPINVMMPSLLTRNA